jgi:hypothetical protein
MNDDSEMEKQIDQAREAFDTGQPVAPFEVESAPPAPESAPPAPVTAKPPKVKRPKKLSRGERLQNAAQEVLDACDSYDSAIEELRGAAEEASSEVENALEALGDVRSEYEEWGIKPGTLRAVPRAMGNLRPRVLRT